MQVVNNNSGSISYLPTGKGKNICFQPGLNKVEDADLAGVKKQAGDKWDTHYSHYLCVQEAPKEPTPEESKTVVQIKEIIGDMDVQAIKALELTEQTRIEGPRKSVIELIGKRKSDLLGNEGDGEGTGDNAPSNE